VLVQDLNSARTSYPFKSHDYKASVSRPSTFPQSNRSSTQTPSHKNNIKGKSLEQNNKNNSPEFFKVSSTTKCYKYQGYGYLAVNCPSLVKIIIIDETPIEATESNSEYTYHPDVETDKSSSDDVGLNCIGPTQSTHYLSSSLFPLHQQKRSIGEELQPFTHSPRLETRVVRWLWTVKVVSMQYHPGCVKNLGLEIIPHRTHSTCHGLTPRQLRSNNDVLFQSVSIITKTRFGVMWSPYVWVKLY